MKLVLFVEMKDKQPSSSNKMMLVIYCSRMHDDSKCYYNVDS